MRKYFLFVCAALIPFAVILWSTSLRLKGGFEGGSRTSAESTMDPAHALDTKALGPTSLDAVVGDAERVTAAADDLLQFSVVNSVTAEPVEYGLLLPVDGFELEDGASASHLLERSEQELLPGQLDARAVRAGLVLFGGGYEPYALSLDLVQGDHLRVEVDPVVAIVVDVGDAPGLAASSEYSFVAVNSLAGGGGASFTESKIRVDGGWPTDSIAFVGVLPGRKRVVLQQFSNTGPGDIFASEAFTARPGVVNHVELMPLVATPLMVDVVNETGSALEMGRVVLVDERSSDSLASSGAQLARGGRISPGESWRYHISFVPVGDYRGVHTGSGHEFRVSAADLRRGVVSATVEGLERFEVLLVDADGTPVVDSGYAGILLKKWAGGAFVRRSRFREGRAQWMTAPGDYRLEIEYPGASRDSHQVEVAIGGSVIPIAIRDSSGTTIEVRFDEAPEGFSLPLTEQFICFCRSSSGERVRAKIRGKSLRKGDGSRFGTSLEALFVSLELPTDGSSVELVIPGMVERWECERILLDSSMSEAVVQVAFGGDGRDR